MQCTSSLSTEYWRITGKKAYMRKISLQTHHVYSTLNRRRNGRFHVVSTWDTRIVCAETESLAFEIYNFQVGLMPPIMSDLFLTRKSKYNPRSFEALECS